jgi:hypothetical protein
VLAVVGIKGYIRCKREEAKGILSAYRVSVSLIMVYFRVCKELTNIICVSKLGYCAFTDSNVLILIAMWGLALA